MRSYCLKFALLGLILAGSLFRPRERTDADTEYRASRLLFAQASSLALTLPPRADTYFPDLTTYRGLGSGVANDKLDFISISSKDREPYRYLAALIFDTSGLETFGTTFRARLRLFIRRCQVDRGGRPLNIEFGLIESEWVPGELTGRTIPKYHRTSVSQLLPGGSEPEDYQKEAEWRNLDVTDLVREWAAGTPNHGIILADTNPGGPYYYHSYCNFGSMESKTVPSLRVMRSSFSEVMLPFVSAN